MKIKYLLTTLMVIVFHWDGFSQNSVTEPSMVDVIAPTPEAAAFLKRSTIDVNAFVGKPNIAIPIHTIQLNQFSWPISLSYDAGGIKVEDVASWVGANWTLNATGLIGRTVKQMPDETRATFGVTSPGDHGYFSQAAGLVYNSSGLPDNSRLRELSDYEGLNTSEITTYGTVSFLDSLADGHIDTQPDFYYFNVGELSGQFYYTQDYELIKMERSYIEFLDYPFKNGVIPCLDFYNCADYEWKIRDGKGITYEFTKAEYMDITSQTGMGNDSETSYYQSSWYLSKMYLGTDTLFFDYKNSGHSLNRLYSETRQCYLTGGGGGCPSTLTNENIVTIGYDIKAIYGTRGDSVVFSSETERSDYDGNILDGIQIFKHGSLVKEYVLHTSYFGNNTKLRLDSLTERNGSTTKPPYIFNYFAGGLPGITSKSQDYWGYYNGSANSTMIPEFKDDYYHFKDNVANREPSLTYTKVGALESIQYPTGGVTVFSYGLNQAFDPDHKESIVKEVIAADGTMANPTVVTDTFSIATERPATYENISMEGTGGIGVNAFAQLRKKNNNGVYVLYDPPTDVINYRNRIILEPGEYQLYAINDGESNENEIRISVEYEVPNPSNIPVGGLRISSIKQYADNEQQDLASNTRYSYYTPNDAGKSSGVLFNKPYVGGYRTTHFPGSIAGIGVCIEDQPVYSLHVNSYASGLLQYQGSHVGYRQVYIENIGEGRVPIVGDNIHPNGIKRLEFQIETPNYIVDHPYVGEEYLSHKNGKLLKEEIFDKDMEHKVFKRENNYTEYAHDKQVSMIKIFREETTFCYRRFLPIQYSSITYHPTNSFLSTSREVTYSQSGDSIFQEKHYRYNNFESLKPTYVETTIGDAYQYDQKYEWQKELLSLSQTYKTPLRLVGTLTIEEQNDYKTGRSKYEYEGTQLVSHKRWNRKTGSDSMDIVYEAVLDAYGNIIRQYTKQGAAKKVFQWGYGHTYPVAQLTTSGNNEFFKVFNFEEDGNTTNAATGLKAQAGTRTISISNVPGNHTYAFAFKARTMGSNATLQVTGGEQSLFQTIEGTNWSYYRKKIVTGTGNTSLQVSIPSGVVIDDLVIFPQEATLNTYTYQVGQGVSSVTDSNGQTQYFEYDDLGRLIATYDNQHHVISRHSYNYKK